MRDEEWKFVTKFHDPDEITAEDEKGRCIIGETDDCVISNGNFIPHYRISQPNLNASALC